MGTLGETYKISSSIRVFVYVVAYETSSLIYHVKPVCYVCNRCLFSLSPSIRVFRYGEEPIPGYEGFHGKF